MKSRNIASRVFALAVAALMLSAPLTTSASADNTPVSSLTAQSKVAPAQAAPTAPVVQFDGKKLYKEVFENLRDRHITLSDPAARAKWVAEWQNKHANDKALDTEESTDKAIYEMIQSLGQRFDYYNPPARNKAEREQFDATLVGIGAQLKLKGQAEAILQARKLGDKATPEQLKQIFDPLKTVSDAHPIIVEEPMEGSPAEKAGIKKGDRIIKVDGADVNGKSLDDVVKTIRGKAGTVVKITVTRDDGKGGTVEQTIDITRAQVVSKVTKVKDLGNGITYIKLNDWTSRFVEKEMFEALTKAAKGKGIVIDLRGNPGGRLDAVETVGQFILKEGTLLVMKERRGDAMVETKTVLQPEFALQLLKSTAQPGKIGMASGEREDMIVPEDMPIAVLIDEGSASASEILSGLLQANKRAVIVGKTSHGKGVGQLVVPLSFDRNIHVTTFEFLPGGVPMDWVGVIPDIEVTNPDEVIVDPTKDMQLDAAKKAVQDAVTKGEARAKKGEDTRKANEDAFQKALDEAKKKASDQGTAPAAPTK
jgi:C-terminal peptidase prc